MVLSGAAFGPQVSNLYKDNDPAANVGHSFVVLDISKWIDLEDFYERMEMFLGQIKAEPRDPGVDDILYPGERLYATYLEKTKKGIVLPNAVRKELERISHKYKVSFPSPNAV